MAQIFPKILVSLLRCREDELRRITLIIFLLYTDEYHNLSCRYHVHENKEPKGILKLSELNVSFAPSKIGHMNSMQLTFMKDGSTRHIYVYHDEAEVINNW